MRREAALRDPQCEQLLLDLMRVAALYVAEHMRGEVAATVAAHLQVGSRVCRGFKAYRRFMVPRVLSSAA